MTMAEVDPSFAAPLCSLLQAPAANTQMKGEHIAHEPAARSVIKFREAVKQTNFLCFALDAPIVGL